jgi:two-component system, OmpR family, alkaline phosphatase synthesis response regulator PhoP
MTSHTILVVDDDTAILDMIAQVLIEGGYQVLTANNGRTAVDLAHQQRPRLILLDLMMPEMNGWQVIDELRASPQTLPIPILLLSARREMARTADELGVTAYLEKPFDLDDLLDRVQHILMPATAAPATSACI